MNAKQSSMLGTSVILCLVVYFSFGFETIMLLFLGATAAAITLTGDSRYGLTPVLVSLAGALICYIIWGIQGSILGIVATVISLAGFIMGISIKGKWSLQGVLSFSGGTMLLAVIGGMYGYNQLYHADCVKQIIEGMKAITYDAITQLESTSATNPAFTSNPEEFNQVMLSFKDSVNNMYELLVPMIPAILILTCAGIAYAIFGIMRFILKRNGMLLPMLPDRRHLIMGRGDGWILILCWILTTFITNKNVVYALSNISAIISVFFFVCGVSLALNLIQYKVKTSPAKWALRILVFFSIGTIIASELYVMAAIIDSVWNFRKIDPITQQ